MRRSERETIDRHATLRRLIEKLANDMKRRLGVASRGRISGRCVSSGWRIPPERILQTLSGESAQALPPSSTEQLPILRTHGAVPRHGGHSAPGSKAQPGDQVLPSRRSRISVRPGVHRRKAGGVLGLTQGAPAGDALRSAGVALALFSEPPGSGDIRPPPVRPIAAAPWRSRSRSRATISPSDEQAVLDEIIRAILDRRSPDSRTIGRG